MLGIPCLVASQADLEWLQEVIGRTPQQPVAVDVEKQEVRFSDGVIKATVSYGPRYQFDGGTWDSTPFACKLGRERGGGGEIAVHERVVSRCQRRGDS